MSTKVQMHSDNYDRGAHPAINVKVHNLGLTVPEIQTRFNCSEKDAERALEFAFDTQREEFWGEINSIAQDQFGSNVEAFSEGRSSGWLVIHGLPDVETWDAEMLAKWSAFENDVAANINDRLNPDSLLDLIHVNRWAEPRSERFNFITTKNKTLCIVDIERELAEKRQEIFDRPEIAS